MEQTLIDSTLKAIQEALERGDPEAAPACPPRLRPDDRADAFADLDDDERAALLPRLGLPDAADLLQDPDDDQAVGAAEALPIGQLADVLDEMEPDEAADVLGDLPPDRAAQALAQMEDADVVRPLLGHPDKTAGGLMTTAYFALRRRTAEAQATDFRRHRDPDAHTPCYPYVVDRVKRLIGVVGHRNLVVADPRATVGTFMERDVLRATAGTDQEEVPRGMSRCDLWARQVIDEQGHLPGVTTQDDVLDVMEEETTEDVLRLSGVEPGPAIDKPCCAQRVVEVARWRFVWLLGLFAAGRLTGTVLRHSGDQLGAVVSLSFFSPLLVGTGGNAGSQSVTTVIRTLALDEVRRRDVLRVLLRELQTGILLGSSLGIVAFGRVLLWGLPTSMAAVVAVTILAICTWANTVGCLVPILADAVGIDATVMSAPLITALVGATGLLIYLRVAALVLHEI